MINLYKWFNIAAFVIALVFFIFIKRDLVGFLSLLFAIGGAYYSYKENYLGPINYIILALLYSYISFKFLLYGEAYSNLVFAAFINSYIFFSIMNHTVITKKIKDRNIIFYIVMFIFIITIYRVLVTLLILNDSLLPIEETINCILLILSLSPIYSGERNKWILFLSKSLMSLHIWLFIGDPYMVFLYIYFVINSLIMLKINFYK